MGYLGSFFFIEYGVLGTPLSKPHKQLNNMKLMLNVLLNSVLGLRALVGGEMEI